MVNKKTVNNIWLQVVFIGPALFFFITFVVIPFFVGIWYSMTRWNGISSNPTFIGFKNYTSILTDSNFLKSIWFTFQFSALTIIIGNLVAFFLALMLTSAIKRRNMYRAVFFLPNVISGFILGFVWQFIFTKVFASIGEAANIGLFQLPWLGSFQTGLWAMVIVQVWQMSGYLMVIYIAGLTNVPKELLESAIIDGAGSWNLLRYIKLPMVMPSITVSLFLSINTAFKVFDLNLSLTRGNFDTRGLALDIYSEAFTSGNYGLGSAKAIFFFVMVAVITIIQTVYTKRKEIEV